MHRLIEEKNRCDEKVSGNSYCVLIINYKLDVYIFGRKCQPCLLVLSLLPAYGVCIQVKTTYLYLHDTVVQGVLCCWVVAGCCLRCVIGVRSQREPSHSVKV